MDPESCLAKRLNSWTCFRPWNYFMTKTSQPADKPTVPSQQEASSQKLSTACSSSPGGTPKDCPMEREDLGRNTWSLLHTMAAYLPDTPTPEDRRDIRHFMSTLGKFYPCDVCANELATHLKINPPDVRTRKDFCQWMCNLHNSVNERLGKPLFDCAEVDQRWKDGWKDGRCD